MLPSLFRVIFVPINQGKINIQFPLYRVSRIFCYINTSIHQLNDLLIHKKMPLHFGRARQRSRGLVISPTLSIYLSWSLISVSLLQVDEGLDVMSQIFVVLTRPVLKQKSSLFTLTDLKDN